ncbi:MAG TPA: hypothetical protein PKY53_07205 [Clostridia bacterium]|nr:hypothetical protein [Clostridia bacterium]
MPKKNKKSEIEEFELQYPGPVVEDEETGDRDYFEEYYMAYKNDYITQYLEAYRRFKEEERNKKQ